jgi:hypothetical protein
MEEARFGSNGVDPSLHRVEEGFARSMPRQPMPQDGIADTLMRRREQPTGSQAEPQWPRVFPSL